MGILRNAIEVIGITAEEDLPEEIGGQLIEYSETDYIYVPENRPLIQNINKIEVSIDIKESRTIKAPTNRIVVLEGSRKINITYRPVGYYDERYILKLNLPFNTFVDIPSDAGEVKAIDIYIADAYFKLINNRKLYCFAVYMVNAVYENTAINKLRVEKAEEIKTLMQYDEEEGSTEITNYY